MITTERHQQPTRTQELEHFISRYLRSQPSDCARAPDLLDSLAAFAPLHAALGRHGDLPDPCHCLIEGYAAPGNAESLRHYLASTGLQRIEIRAVDLYDIAATYSNMGQAIPAMRYDLADARDLRGVVPDASIDLVIQDFLVNCVQPRHMPAIFQEVRRVLSPAGLAFISFSDDQCMQDVDRVSEEDNSQIQMIDESLIFAQPADLLQRCLGRRFRVACRGSWGFVTRPHGRLEFFSPLAQTRADIADSGLEILAHSVSRGLDDHGLRCVRHRCILGAQQVAGER